MKNNKQNRLELTWVGKGDEPKIEPRILIEDPQYSYGDANTENMIIHGDNLLALKSLEQDFAGKVKCIYIDPPYNTGNAFEHYDDGLEHSIWLGLMSARLKMLYTLLAEDGSIWISIDADESHYLKVLCDEIFGRRNFVDEVIWQRAYAPINLKKTLSRSHDAILVYSKMGSNFELNKLARSEEANARYKNPDGDVRGLWTSDNLSVGPAIDKNIYEITTPSGRKALPPKGYSWRLSQNRLAEFIADNRIWFGEDGGNVPRIKRFLSEVKDGVTPMTLWTYQEVGHNQDAKKEVKQFNDDDVFATPKPEKLIERIIHLATKPGDLILDSFLGSGTTAAVAHKMGRRYIGIELGDHAYTHCVVRIRKVIDGEQGGISKAVNWQGGGGFKFYELAPSLLQQNKYEQWVINKDYDTKMLAEAMAKHQGFTYHPYPEVYWKQGKSSEQDYIYTTTQFVTGELVDRLAMELAPQETLLICAPHFVKGIESHYSNISLCKIPAVLLKGCDFSKDNYNLNVNSTARNDEDIEMLDDCESRSVDNENDLFSNGEDDPS